MASIAAPAMASTRNKVLSTRCDGLTGNEERQGYGVQRCDGQKPNACQCEDLRHDDPPYTDSGTILGVFFGGGLMSKAKIRWPPESKSDSQDRFLGLVSPGVHPEAKTAVRVKNRH